MSQLIDVNGQSINYPEIGDTNWGDEATDFAVQTSAAFGKLGLASGTSVDIAQTLDVTGNTTLDANLSVAGNTTLTGNLTANGNTALGNASGDTITITGIVNVDSGVLYVDPVNNRVGINDTTPSQALDVTGNAAITGNETVGGTLNVTGATSLSSTLGVTGDVAVNTNKFNVTASSGNTTIAGTLGVTGNTTLTGQTLASDGTALLPGISFSSDPNTGLYRIGSDNIGFSTNGLISGQITTSGWIISQQYVCFVDEKSNNTEGGTFTSGDWRTRVLNTTRGTNSIAGSSLSSNQFTLPSGTYKIYATCPALGVSLHKARLQNITDGTTVLIGSSERTDNTDTVSTNSIVSGTFTINSQKTFELQHRCSLTVNTVGFGSPSNFSVVEVYSQIEIWRIV